MRAGAPSTQEAPPDTGLGTPPIVDLGAYEYQGVTPLGDLNCDGVVNIDDIAPFALALVDPAAYQAQHPGCSPARADLNQDTHQDGADIQPFVDLLLPPP